VDAVHPLRRFAGRLGRLEMIGDADPADDQHLVLGFDLTFHVGGQSAVGCIYLTRLQRASQGAGQSATGGSDHVVKGGRVRLGELAFGESVVLGDGPVHAETDRLFFRRQIGQAIMPFEPFDAYF